MNAMTLDILHRLRRRLDADFGDLVDWSAFSLEAVRAAVARRVGGTISLCPFHWEDRGYFGLALGCTVQDRPRWLVLYEQEARADHRHMIVLHELMHIALGHREATLSPEELRRELIALDLLDALSNINYARACMPGPAHRLLNDLDDEEAEAEIAAAWALWRARRAGSVPLAGQLFAPEHIAISSFLGGMDGQC